jgi:transposase
VSRPHEHADANVADDAAEEVPGSDRSVLDVVRDIRAGARDARTLAAGDRRLCVMHLTAECLSVAEIAQVLGVSERTVARDRRQIQEEQAIRPDPLFTSVFAGKLLQETEALRAQVHRVLRDKDAPQAVRVEAARVSHEMLDKLAVRLQGMGFLHAAPQRTLAEITHFSGDTATLDEVLREQERLQGVLREIAAQQSAKPESAVASEPPPASEGVPR